MKAKLVVTISYLCTIFVLVGFKSQVKDLDSGKKDSMNSSTVKPPLPHLSPLTAAPFEEKADRKGNPGGSAAGTKILYWINCGGQKWLNYNHRRKKLSSAHIDWPITIIFYGNATVDKVKKMYGGSMFASRKYQAYDIGTGVKWDSDVGIKISMLFDGPDGKDKDILHIRLYAPPGGYFDGDGGWGHYVIAATHFDFNPPWDTKNGYSEDAERQALRIASMRGYTVYSSYAHLHNREHLRKEKNRYWQSDGRVSLVYIH